MNKEVLLERTKKIEEGNSRPRKFFSEKQIKNAEKSFSKWLHFIIAESGHGRIEVVVDRGLVRIDVRPTPSFRYYQD